MISLIFFGIIALHPIRKEYPFHCHIRARYEYLFSIVSKSFSRTASAFPSSSFLCTASAKTRESSILMSLFMDPRVSLRSPKDDREGVSPKDDREEKPSPKDDREKERSPKENKVRELSR